MARNLDFFAIDRDPFPLPEHGPKLAEIRSEPGRKRHLFRMWLKCLDGRPLPRWFCDRQGPRGTVDRPGGITGAGTVRSVPLEVA